MRKREENPDCSVTAGYVKSRAEKTGINADDFLDTQDLPEECPVCAVYCTGREWQCFSCGWVTFDKNGTTVCNLFCRTMRQLPTRMLWQESELAEMALTGQDNCRAFMNVRQGEQCRRMTALRKCGGAMRGCQC